MYKCNKIREMLRRQWLNKERAPEADVMREQCRTISHCEYRILQIFLLKYERIFIQNAATHQLRDIDMD
jgi:hypothetical protein